MTERSEGREELVPTYKGVTVPDASNGPFTTGLGYFWSLGEWKEAVDNDLREQALFSGRYTYPDQHGVSCARCGALVSEISVHDDWHKRFLEES